MLKWVFGARFPWLHYHGAMVSNAIHTQQIHEHLPRYSALYLLVYIITLNAWEGDLQINAPLTTTILTVQWLSGKRPWAKRAQRVSNMRALIAEKETVILQSRTCSFHMLWISITTVMFSCEGHLICLHTDQAWMVIGQHIIRNGSETSQCSDELKSVTKIMQGIKSSHNNYN